METTRSVTLVAALVARADHLAGLDAAAGQRQRPAVRPVIAAQVGIDDRRAAEFAHRDHQRGLQQAALVQVFHQRGERAVERRRQPIAVALVVVAVGVPGIPW